eukprot:TRINITY_DN9936_c0_g1_i1.p1 TRINITY_DN9936_c0_g1~~TRINITY_DN9936_c0_g1_i1.p1  ORF type:complete len:473 (+),score=130.61 TRINITY_DN9936_c0_g1_i1:89-1420(+)
MATPPPLSSGAPPAQPQHGMGHPVPPPPGYPPVGPPPRPPGSLAPPQQQQQQQPQQQAGSGLPVEHALSLKVMRLRRPELDFERAVYLEEGDPMRGIADTNSYGLQTDLMLPPSFGDIHVGETFRSYISLHNGSATAVKNVAVKVDLLTQSQKVTLTDNQSTPISQLPPGQNRDFIVDYVLNEKDSHTLMCHVTYADDEHLDMKRFRKIFKFPVAKAIDLKGVKIFTLYGHVFIVLELQNLTALPLSVASVRLDPESAYKVADHSTHNKGAAWQEMMNPQEVRRFLFELVPCQAAREAERGQASALGKVHIEWRTNMGEQGQLVTSTITHRPLDRRDLDLTAVAPERVQLREPFTLRGEVRNNTSFPLESALHLHPERAYPLLFSGAAQRPLPTIPPGGVHQYEIELTPLAVGVQGVSGIELRDLKSDRSVSLLQQCTVYVER